MTISHGPTSFAKNLDVEITTVDGTNDLEFKKSVQRSIDQIIQFSKANNLPIKDTDKFVSKIVLYGSKQAFDKMIRASPDWPKNKLVPPNYVGIGEKKIFHVVSWTAYKIIHPSDARADYDKLLTHELAHLLHIAYLKGDEDRMGPMWFFEGFACFVANQYPDAKLPDKAMIRQIIAEPNRGNYRTYVPILRALAEKRSVVELLDHAADSDFATKSESLLID